MSATATTASTATSPSPSPSPSPSAFNSGLSQNRASATPTSMPSPATVRRQMFEAVMASPRLLAAFELFLVKSVREENMAFWRRLKSFQADAAATETASPEFVLSEAESIVRDFFGVDSEFEINVTHGCKETVAKQLELIKQQIDLLLLSPKSPSSDATSAEITPSPSSSSSAAPADAIAADLPAAHGEVASANETQSEASPASAVPANQRPDLRISIPSATVKAAAAADSAASESRESLLAKLANLFSDAEQQIQSILLNAFAEYTADADPMALEEIKSSQEIPAWKKRVVVIGGGFTGFTVAQSLDKIANFHVTLIDKKEYLEYTPSMIVYLVRDFDLPINCPHSSYIKNGRFILGVAEGVFDNYVVVSGKKVSYDYLVVCTGSSYLAQFKSENKTTEYNMKHLRRDRAELEKADSILVIGGGLVGVEISTEVKAKYPEKQVTLVEANPTLLKRLSTSVQTKIIEEVKRLGVNVVLNERIVDFRKAKKLYISANGKEFTADKVFIATGPIPCSSFMKNGCLSSAIDATGRLKVNRYLQVDGFSNIFAGGDVSGFGDEKTAMAARRCGSIIARNICRMEKRKELIYGGQKGLMPLNPELIIISVGDKKAAMVFYSKYATIGKVALGIKYKVGKDYIHIAKNDMLSPSSHYVGRGPSPSSEPLKPKIRKQSRSRGKKSASKLTSESPDAIETSDKKGEATATDSAHAEAPAPQAAATSTLATTIALSTL